MGSPNHTEQFERCWQACWHRARRPVEGILLDEDQASKIAEQTIRNVSLDYETLPPEAEFTAKALEETARGTKQMVAMLRREKGDLQLHRDPGDRRYDANLDLDKLQKRTAGRGFQDREWNKLVPLLKPLALATLSRKGIRSFDADEVFNDSLAELVRERADTGHAPILDPTVFEEIIPLHSRIVSFRAVDWYRRKGALKNQPNQGDSIDALTDSKERSFQFADTSAEPGKPSFESIYSECQQSLTPAEWELVYALYVAQTSTIQDLIGDERICGRFGLKKTASASTRRRRLGEAIETALGKIRKTLLS